MARNDDLCEGYISSWALIPNSCTVVLNNGAGGLTPIDFSFLLDKVVIPDQASTFDYLPGSHTVVHNGVPHALNCGRFTFNPATCELGYVDEKGQVTTALIPQDQFIYDAASCTLTVLPAKGGAGMVIPTGVPSTGVNLEFVQTAFGCSLRLTYKDRSIDVPMPNMLVGHQYDCATNTLRFLYCNGDDVTETLAKASMQCNTLDDGTRIITFNDGCGGPSKVFDLQPINMDIDELTIAGSVLTFTSGGDGNPGVVVVDICEVVATNCNATFTAINADGSWSFVDNAGNDFTYPAPINCCTFHNVSPNDLDPDTPPATPQGAYPNKQDGDTIIQCHPNGLSYWTCVDGAWVLDFIKVIIDVRNYFLSDPDNIDPGNLPATPPASPRTSNKIDGDTLLVCYPNGFCAFTCNSGVWVRDWCKVDPVAAGHTSPDNSLSVVFNPTTGNFEYSVDIPDRFVPEKETFKSGDTLPQSMVGSVSVCAGDDSTVLVLSAGDTLPEDLLGCVQVDETDGSPAYIPPKAPREVHIGTTAPAKGQGFLVWFDPDACVVRFCDGADGWSENRRVVCSDEAPPTDKGGADIWYSETDSCLSVLCEGAWVAVNKVSLPTKSGQPISESNRIVDEQIDPIVERSCEDLAMCTTHCSGREIAETYQHVWQRTQVNQGSLSGYGPTALPLVVGETYGAYEPPCIEVDNGKCPGNFMLSFQHSGTWLSIGGQAAFVTGDFNVLPAFSVDGGATYTNVIWGGVDRYQLERTTDTGIRALSEQEFNDEWITPQLGPGLHTLCFAVFIFLVENEVLEGENRPAAQFFSARKLEAICHEI